MIYSIDQRKGEWKEMKAELKIKCTPKEIEALEIEEAKDYED